MLRKHLPLFRIKIEGIELNKYNAQGLQIRQYWGSSIFFPCGKKIFSSFPQWLHISRWAKAALLGVPQRLHGSPGSVAMTEKPGRWQEGQQEFSFSRRSCAVS